ncbi:MAG: hypothetical protein ACRDXX_09765 [Stackebrandtia sp.]
MSSLLNETQAYPRAEQHLHDAADALGVDVRLVPGVRNAVEILAEIDDEPALVNVEVSYSCELPKPEGDVFDRNRRLFERLGDWWRTQGYRIVTEEMSEPFTVLRVADPDDGFVIALRQGKIGNLWFTVNSPPVTATGAEAPPPGLA